jgi:hypothetical protein
MKIVLDVSVAGPDFAFGKGEHDVPHEIGTMLVKAGHAHVLKTEAKRGIEKATKPKGEVRSE